MFDRKLFVKETHQRLTNKTGLTDHPGISLTWKIRYNCVMFYMAQKACNA